jgi:menaquinone-dependent protoporphyrinogen IX oxidase
MKSLIIYGSQYGTAKAYATKLSEITEIPCISYENIKDIKDYEQIIYFGGLYAGGVKGLKNTFRLLKNSNIKTILVTVGLADVNNKENTNNIKASLEKHIYKNSLIFHLRGGIDYSKLNFKHKTMMKMLYHSLKNKPIESLTQEDKALIETYNTKVDFVDYDSLKQIVEVIQ